MVHGEAGRHAGKYDMQDTCLAYIYQCVHHIKRTSQLTHTHGDTETFACTSDKKHSLGLLCVVDFFRVQFDSITSVTGAINGPINNSFYDG
jgi:hypothetical protein